jgi:hypothetical protein
MITSSEGRMKAGVKCLRSWLKTGIIGEVLARSWANGGGVYVNKWVMSMALGPRRVEVKVKTG